MDDNNVCACGMKVKTIGVVIFLGDQKKLVDHEQERKNRERVFALLAVATLTIQNLKNYEL